MYVCFMCPCSTKRANLFHTQLPAQQAKRALQQFTKNFLVVEVSIMPVMTSSCDTMHPPFHAVLLHLHAFVNMTPLGTTANSSICFFWLPALPNNHTHESRGMGLGFIPSPFHRCLQQWLCSTSSV